MHNFVNEFKKFVLIENFIRHLDVYVETCIFIKSIFVYLCIIF